MKAVSVLLPALLIAEAVFVAPVRARSPADFTFQRFGSFSLDCEQVGTNKQVRVEIDAQRDVPTISFIACLSG